MSPQLFWGLIVAVILLSVLIIVALKNKKNLPLEALIGVAISGVSLVGAAKLLIVSLSDALASIPHADNVSRWLTLSPDDALYLFVGALALAWVSIDSISKGYKTVL